MSEFVPKTLAIPADNSGCGFLRIAQPAKWLRHAGWEIRLGEYTNIKAEDINWCDLMVLQRPSAAYHVSAIKYAQSQGKKVVFELDDYIPGILPCNPGYQAWTPQNLNMARCYHALTLCDAVTTTTEALANEFRPFNKNVFILPNYLDLALWDKRLPFRDTERIRIGWTGGCSHLVDLEIISPVMVDICREYPKVKFVLFGFIPEKVFEAIPSMVEPCKACGYEGQIEFRQGVEILKYPAAVASTGIDVGLAPIIDVAFNRAKSDLKLKEYMRLGVPWVASDVGPYQPWKTSGAGYAASNHPDDWKRYLKLLIEDKEVRKAMGEKGYELSKDFSIALHIDQWKLAYLRILGKS
jgi:glycosyltransferase involved in cell wall biosynthesis